MGFVAFDEKRVKRTEPAVSLTTNGNFNLNAACVRGYFKGIKHAKLYWDVSQNKIGIKPMQTPDEFTYRVTMSSKRSIGTFSGTAFVKKIGIVYKDKTRAFPASWNETEQLIEFSVAEVLKKKGKE